MSFAPVYETDYHSIMLGPVLASELYEAKRVRRPWYVPEWLARWWWPDSWGLVDRARGLTRELDHLSRKHWDGGVDCVFAEITYRGLEVFSHVPKGKK